MKKAFVCIAVAALAACSGGEAGDSASGSSASSASTSDGFPPACDALRGLDAAALLGEGAVYEEIFSNANEDVAASSCMVTVDDGERMIGLTVRADIAGDAKRSSADQAQGVIDANGLPTEPVDLGEAAFWSPEFDQLHVFYREGNVYIIIDGTDGKDAAIAFAKRVMNAHP